MNLKEFDELLGKVVVELNDDDEYEVTPAEAGNPELDRMCWDMSRFIYNLRPILEESMDAMDIPRQMVWEPPETDVVHYKISHDAPISDIEIQLITRLNKMRESNGLSRIITVPTTRLEDEDDA